MAKVPLLHEVHATSESQKRSLTLDDVVISYPGATVPVVTLRHLSFAVGSFTCIVGRSGCGKSTLLSCIAGLVQPTSGKLSWGESKESARHVGMVFQDAALFPWMKIVDNVTIALRHEAMSRREMRARAIEALNVVGLKHFTKAFPGALSGGMKQRAVLARYLAAECDLLLMDEPFSGLDQFTREEMQDLLVQLYRGRSMTCIFVTHSLVEAVYLGNRVIVLGGKPAKIIDDITVHDPYPRAAESRVSSEHAPLRERLYKAIRNANASDNDST